MNGELRSVVLWMGLDIEDPCMTGQVIARLVQRGVTITIRADGFVRGHTLVELRDNQRMGGYSGGGSGTSLEQALARAVHHMAQHDSRYDYNFLREPR